MLSPEIIKQIRGLQIKAGHLANDALTGEYSSAFKGSGMEFDEVREYVPGDDVRTIDWNVTARMNAPFVKKFREEREMTVMLMVDVSPSQGFGTTGRFKSEITAELAAVLAFLAIKNNDKVGLIAFSDHVEHFIPAQKGRAHVWKIIREVIDHRGRGKATDVSAAFDYLLTVQKRRCMCFMISDFWAVNYEKSLRIAAKRHSLTCVRVSDPRESELASCGFMEFEDRESGRRVIVDTTDAKVRLAYKRKMEQQDLEISRRFRRYGVDSFRIRTDESVTAPLIQYMRRRERRFR
jgi:uncharacterized protein (DUF58 family)